MTTNQTASKKTEDSYVQFVKQIEIEDVRLVALKLSKVDTSYYLESADVLWRDGAHYVNREGMIDVFHEFDVKVIDRKTRRVKAKLLITFCATYSSTIPMTDELFSTFETRNLPLNTWPYFRELTQSMTLRMGWPAFVASTYKS